MSEGVRKEMSEGASERVREKVREGMREGKEGKMGG